MAARSSLAAKRRLSLDILAASKANEERIKGFAWQNSPGQNVVSDSSDLHNGTPRAAANKPAHYAKKNKVNDVEKEERRKKKQQATPQVLEVKLTLTQKYLSWRFLNVLLLQSSFVVAIFLRNCLPMAMVCMVKPRSSQLSADGSNKTGLADGLQASESQNLKTVSQNTTSYNRSVHWKEPFYEFEWSPEVQGLVLSSIMFSTFIGPLLGSAVKVRLGNKLTLTVSTLTSTLLTFLCPAATRISPYCLVAIRIVLGISLGGNIPVIGDCVAWWAPQDEKLTMVALVFTGVNIGNILASFVAGYLCLVPLDNGWPFVFYTFGAFSLLWCLFWHFLSAEKPENHPYISEKEKEYIISHRTGLGPSPEGKQVKLPYRKLLTSGPVLAYFASTTCHVWSTQIVFTYLPVFFNKVMKFSVQETGLLVSLTSTFRMIGTLIWTVLGNKLVSVVSVNKSRKICICTGFLLGGIMAIIVGFFDDEYKWLVLGLLIVLMLAQSVGASTLSALPLDMAPRYAGLLTGMCISLGSLISISGPLLTAAITAEGTQEEWRTVWIVMGCVFISGFAIFLSFGHATMQPWATGIDTQKFNIMSPFVTMGRRFSTFLEAPPLSPVSPVGKDFDFSTTYRIPSASGLAQLAIASPDIFFTGNLDFSKTVVPDRNLEPTQESLDSEDAESTEQDNESGNEEDAVEQIKKARRRAVSESGLEVLRLNLEQESASEERGAMFEWYNKAEENVVGLAMADTLNVHTGVVNYAYEDRETGGNVHSEATLSTRL
ncbi:hypothetical protein BsWGS_26728 [Bradybaena similaris]